MTGVFNTSGHETESQAEIAASHLFEGLALVNQMLSKVELKDVKLADVERQKAIALLASRAPEFENLQARRTTARCFGQCRVPLYPLESPTVVRIAEPTPPLWNQSLAPEP